MPTEISFAHSDRIAVSGNVIKATFATIDASRNPVRRFQLLFDTGAFITLINKDRAILNRYAVFEEKGCIISGFSEKGLVCDLRKISTVVFCGFRIDDVLIATPHDDDVRVTEVLGMNILENFIFGVDIASEEIYMSVRPAFVSQKPKYKSGHVSLLQDSGEDSLRQSK